VRRLDAALIGGGLTPLPSAEIQERGHLSVAAIYRSRRRSSGRIKSGVKPPDTKAASSRRTPNDYD